MQDFVNVKFELAGSGIQKHIIKTELRPVLVGLLLDKKKSLLDLLGMK